MKKQYVIAMLVLIGLGIVSTMAFSYNTSLDVTTDVYAVGDAGATGTVTKVKVVPVSGSLDKMKIMITMTNQTVNFDVFISLNGAVLTGITPASDVTVTSGSAGTPDLATGYLEYTGCTALGASGTWTMTIDATSASGLTDSLWQDTTGLTIAIADS